VLLPWGECIRLKVISRLAAVAATAALWCGAAEAKVATITVHGTLISEGPGPDVDPNLALGDPVDVTFDFDSSAGIELAEWGFFIAQIHPSVRSGAFPMPFFDIHDDVPIARQDYYTFCGIDAGELCYNYEGGDVIINDAAVIYQGSKILGLIGRSAPSDAGYGPDYDFGSYPYDFTDHCYRDSVGSPYVCGQEPGTPFNPYLSDTFYIVGPTHLSEYRTQGFDGQWDFDAVSLPVP